MKSLRRRIGVSVAVATVLLPLALGVRAQAALERPTYVIRDDAPPIGSNIRRRVVGPTSVAINRRYADLSDKERAVVHGWWEDMAPGDEPPFPVDGMWPIHDAVRKAQGKLLVSGELFLVASVGADGQVSSVKALGSPSDDMTKFAARLLMFTTFKPARCSDHPCAMEFPLRYTFVVE